MIRYRFNHRRVALVVSILLLVACAGGKGSDRDAGLGDLGAPPQDAGPTADAGSPPPDAGVATDQCNPIDLPSRTGDGPASLLNEASLQTVPTAQAVRPLGGNGQHRVAQASLNGRSLVITEFKMRAFADQWGRPWQVPVIVMTPMPGELRSPNAAILSTGLGFSQAVGSDAEDPVWGPSHPSWFLGGRKSADRSQLATWFDRDESAQTLAHNFVFEMGMPVVIMSVVPAGIDLAASPVGSVLNQAMRANAETCDDDFCVGGLDPHHLTNCLLRAALLEDDLTYDPYIRYAITAMRALDGAQHVINGLYEAQGSQDRLALQSVFGLGCSKYGHTLRTLAAVEPRIAGVMVGCADISNAPAFFAQQDLLWQDSYSFVGTREIYEATPPAVLRRWQNTFDQANWKESVLGSKAMILATGTRDHLYPLPASYAYSNAMPANHSYLFVPNFGHGIGSIDHIGTLRSMVTRTLAGEDLLQVEARWAFDSDQVVARLNGAAAIEAQLWCSTRMVPSESAVPNVCGDRPTLTPTMGTDLRHAWFEKVDMVDAGDGSWRGTVPNSEYDAPACLVRMRSAADDVVTSQPLLSASLCRSAGLAP